MILNIFKHFKKIMTHKYYVFIYCCKAGIIWRGIKHDMSKFSPTEFIESVQYYMGTSSPIDECKRQNGYSKAWQHHKGRNTHHYEYWMDNFDRGGTPIMMPYNDALEMFCDYIAAGKAYMGKNFSWSKEFDWWNAKKKQCAMHPKTMRFIDLCFKWANTYQHFPPKEMFQYYHQCSLAYGKEHE